MTRPSRSLTRRTAVDQLGDISGNAGRNFGMTPGYSDISTEHVTRYFSLFRKSQNSKFLFFFWAHKEALLPRRGRIRNS
jgi:hypothetical protein